MLQYNRKQCFKFILFRDANTSANENTSIKIIYLNRYTENTKILPPFQGYTSTPSFNKMIFPQT